MNRSNTPRYGGHLIHAVRDDWGLIEVVDYPGKRSLHFGTPIQQSCLRFNAEYNPGFHYERKMMFGAALHQHPQKVLILGIGGGTIARHLYQNLTAAQITAVDRREAVIDIALEYFELPADDRMQLYTADAEQFLTEAPAEWDLILVDLFDAIGIDETALRLSFLDRCFAQLNDGGILVMNLWRDNDTAYFTACNYLETCFENQLWYLDEADGNTIAYAFKDSFPKHSSSIQSTAKRLCLDDQYLVRKLKQRNGKRISL